MNIYFEENVSEVIIFAAKELADYLRRMMGEAEGEEVKIRLCADKNAFPETVNDSFCVQIDEAGGTIAGSNDRSVLLGVYDYLHFLGCRFLMPGKESEIVPQIERKRLAASYGKEASYFHRGICIEGADSFENVVDTIAWLPKVGFNAFFLQFKTPYAFLDRWYAHKENPYTEAEWYTPEDAVRDMERFEQEMKKRGLLLHKVGHGWTGEVIGYQTVSWNAETERGDGHFNPRMAMIGGVRGLNDGVPANTNLCYSNAEAAEAFVSLVVSYAKEHPSVDYLHVWLADEYNNLCECPECSRTTLSDQYVGLLNEIDRRLTEEKLDTHIVFLLYQELLWPPVVQRFVHPERFVLMFAPISRTFERSYELEKLVPVPDFVRNHVTLPTGLPENMAFLRQWQKVFAGESFVYDYPLGRAHYGDFGYVHIAKVIYEDIRKLERMGLDGYISCQELRAAFPNALPNYVMGYTLFQKDIPLRELVEEYFSACYGAEWEKALAYLTELSDLNCCDYVNGKGEREDKEIAERMERVSLCLRKFEKELDKHCGEGVFWKILAYHREYVALFSEALRLFALGEKGQAAEKLAEVREYIGRNEPEYQPFFDVYRMLEVTRRYTGL